jgi:hypothetical protein
MLTCKCPVFTGISTGGAAIERLFPFSLQLAFIVLYPRTTLASEHRSSQGGSPTRGELPSGFRRAERRQQFPNLTRCCNLAEHGYGLALIGNVVASAYPASRLCRAVPSVLSRPAAFRRDVLARNQARRLPRDCAQGRSRVKLYSRPGNDPDRAGGSAYAKRPRFGHEFRIKVGWMGARRAPLWLPCS